MKKNLRNFISGVFIALLLLLSVSLSAQNPVITSTPVVVASVGQPYNYDVDASGTATITYALVTYPAGMTINSTTGEISWVPSSTSQNGLVKVTASNPSYPPAAEQTFIINITELTPCPDGATGLWQLNETAGSVYADHYGVSEAVATVAPVPTTGIVNGAQTFSPTTRVSITDNGSWEWEATSSFSMEVWIKTTATLGASDIDVFLGRFRHDDYPVTWLLGMNGAEKPIFYLRDALYGHDASRHDTSIIGPVAINDGLWHHIVAVRDESQNKNKLYVDGVKVIEATINYPNSFKCADFGAVPVTLGWYDSGDGHGFSGAIDEAAIYNKALTDLEIAQYYNNGAPVGHCNVQNYAPVIESEPVTVATQGTAYSYSFITDDYDVSDALVLSAVKKPSWLSFNWTAGLRTATLTGTPQNGNVGDTTVTLNVTDGSLSKEQTFTISVANVNDSPVITSTPIFTVDEGVVYSYAITATDIDRTDVLTYAAVSKPAWLTFTPANGTLTGTPASGDVGEHQVTLSVSDGTVVIPQSFTITVNSVNIIPVITGQVILSVDKNESIELSLDDFTVNDADNDYPEDFTLSLIDGNNYSVSGLIVSPDADYTGNINVGIQVNDGTANSGIYYALIEVKLPSATNNPDLNKLLTVYPNPGRDHITFKFDKTIKSGILEIYNTSGSLVKRMDIKESINRIDAGDLGAGTFIYRVQSADVLLKGNFVILGE